MQQIGTGQIADGAVTTPKIAQDSLSIITNEHFGLSVNLAPGESDTCDSGETLIGGGYMSVFPVLNFYHNGLPFGVPIEDGKWRVSGLHTGMRHYNTIINRPAANSSLT